MAAHRPINTDAIDNVAGVNCSDHEVNIKILLDALVADGDLTEKQRNELLAEMTDAVAEQVLYAQLHADAGDEPRARTGRADGRRARAADPRTSSRPRGSTASSSSCPPTR